MIRIKKSETADTRSCDSANVTKEQLRSSSVQHMTDVWHGMTFFRAMLKLAAIGHDEDKITDLDGFYRDFIEGSDGFTDKEWYQKHIKLNRHHLMQEGGVPLNVNLTDVLDMIVDCVMAGMARTGEVYPLALPPELLQEAFDNTVKLLKENVVVE